MLSAMHFSVEICRRHTDAVRLWVNVTKPMATAQVASCKPSA
jgi:hypothetical protein